MTAVVVYVLLALAAISLGLRTTSVLIPRVHPVARLIAAILIGGIFTAATLQVSDRYHVYDMGLGLLLSLAPVGVFDLLKWWFRWRRPSS
jgi:hypothetical protein